MAGTDLYDELADLIYAGLLGEVRWQTFLDRFAEDIPDGRALFLTQGHGGSGFSALSRGLDQADLDAYGSYFGAINPWMQALHNSLPRKAVVGHRLYPDRELRRGEFYADFLTPLGAESTVGLIIDNRADQLFNITTLSSNTDPERSEQWAMLLDRLAPHLRRASRFYRRTTVLGPTEELGATLFDALETGVILIDNGPRLRRMNDTTRHLNKGGRIFRHSPVGRFHFACPDAQAALETLLAARESEPRIRQLLIGSQPVTLVRIVGQGLGALLQGPLVIAICPGRSPGRSPAPAIRDQAGLARDYGLTQAEVRVLQGLLGDLSLSDISRGAGVSLETTRSQLRRVFEKTATRSQVQLVNRIRRDEARGDSD